MKKQHVLLSLFVLLFTKASMAIEEPKYSVIEKSGEYELRSYGPMIVAETVVSGSADKASKAGFRLIADYIFGNNALRSGENEEISMTAPVTMEPQSEEISMTAPVTMKNSNGQWRIHFVMPSSYTMESLPKPNNAQVSLREIPARNYAVIRFSGLAGEVKVAKKTQQLIQWMSSKNIDPEGEPEMARYNPPWTVPFFRRNEVMIAY